MAATFLTDEMITRGLKRLMEENNEKELESEPIHEFVSVITDDNNENFVQTHRCQLGDAWIHKYPAPLSSYPSRPISTGSLFHDKIIPELPNYGFKPLQIIARGKTSTVILAQDQRPNKLAESEFKPVAIKLHTSRKHKQLSAREYVIIMRLSHPNIVTFLDVLSIQGRSGLVLEFCENGTLENLLCAQEARFITEPVARRYFRQIVDALEYVHLSGIAHRDVSTQNMLVTNNNNIQLSDFGHAVQFTTGDELCSDTCGTLGFIAPEVVCAVPHNPKLADLWALGAVLYSMVVGKLPYGRIRKKEMARSIKTVEFPEDNVMILSKEVKELLKGLLMYVPDSRYTFNRTRTCEWMTRQDVSVHIGNFYLVRQPKKVSEGVGMEEQSISNCDASTS